MSDKKPVGETSFWKERLEDVQRRGQPLHYSVFRCEENKWGEICRRHQQQLAEVVGADTGILDVGCGYGRLLELLPGDWIGPYLGVDLSPDFISLAKRRHPYYNFQCVNLETHPIDTSETFDLAIGVSIEGMVIREQGYDVWRRIDTNIRNYADEVLYLEYTQ